MVGGQHSSRHGTFPLAALICLAATALLVTIFVRVVDLKPKVGQAFFFSNTDPQVATDNAILREFPESPQIILAATGDIRSPAYAERIAALTRELAALPNVSSVQSLSHGPHDIDDALKSPLWRPLLIAPNQRSTELYVALRTPSAAAITTRLEALQRRYDRPGFRVTISGIPYVTELIARNLSRDLRVFSIAAVAVFGLVLLAVFRSAWALLGTFVACGDSSAATLIVTHLVDIPIGPLTANLSTIVFVMTLSPIVFLTFNFKRIRREGDRQGRDALREAVVQTVTSSCWSSICMLLGFISLLFVPSTPMRHLGIAGAIGAVMALVAAYTVYPWFLERMGATPSAAGATHRVAERLRDFFGRRHGGIVAAMVAFTLIGAYGLRHLNTDPDLPSYFKRGGDIRRGLEAIDENGGSSPLKLVLEDEDHAPLDKGKEYKRLRALQDSLDEDPAVGSVVSLAMVLGEAKRPFLARFLSTSHLVKILDTPKYGEVSRELISPDRTKTLFILRMKETEQPAPRSTVIARLKHTVARQGFRTVQIGGAYDLLEEMARLLTSSIVTGRALADRHLRPARPGVLPVTARCGCDAGQSRDDSGRSPRVHRIPGHAARFHYSLRVQHRPRHGRRCHDLPHPGGAPRRRRNARSGRRLVDRVLAALATDRDVAPRDLFRVRNFPAVEFSADAAIRPLRDSWFGDRSERRVVRLSLAGDRGNAAATSSSTVRVEWPIVKTEWSNIAACASPAPAT